jgi:hypothetical protein
VLWCPYSYGDPSPISPARHSRAGTAHPPPLSTLPPTGGTGTSRHSLVSYRILRSWSVFPGCCRATVGYLWVPGGGGCGIQPEGWGFEGIEALAL